MAAFSDRKLAWLVYTVLFGMVPIFMRLSAFALVNGDKIPMFSASDFISLGIVLHVSLMAETRYSEGEGSDWKKTIVGLSVLAVLFYAVLYIFSMLAEIYADINRSVVFWAPVVMTFGSFAMCWVVYDRLTYIPAPSEEVVA